VAAKRGPLVSTRYFDALSTEIPPRKGGRSILPTTLNKLRTRDVTIMMRRTAHCDDPTQACFSHIA